jgi:dihydroorotase/N-acyl-D-amino-acid deacylase
MVVAPGFIDMLGQSDLSILANPHVPSKLFQGITTEITGEGNTVAPLNPTVVSLDRAIYEHFGIEPDWVSFHGYFERLEKQGIAINFGSLVGATQIRRVVLGNSVRSPNKRELEAMVAIAEAAMRDGAIGLSTALSYSPGAFATTEEIIELAKVSGKYGGIYATHLRSEGAEIMSALDEAILVGRAANVPVEVWHLKAAGKSNWGKMKEVISQIDKARHDGVDIAANTYAYTSWYNSLSALLPLWALEGGRAQLIARLDNPDVRMKIYKEMKEGESKQDNFWKDLGPDEIVVAVVFHDNLLYLQGKSISELAMIWSKDPLDSLLDLLIYDEALTIGITFGMSEEDVELALKQPWVSIGTDAQGTAPEGILGKERPHPRAYGTFPRILRKYVREEHTIALEDAIRKFTALPAQRIGLTDRGLLRKGMWGDVVIFDPEAITDRADLSNPHQFSHGVHYVLVNGTLVVERGALTEALPGMVLRHRRN